MFTGRASTIKRQSSGSIDLVSLAVALSGTIRLALDHLQVVIYKCCQTKKLSNMLINIIMVLISLDSWSISLSVLESIQS